MPPSASPLRVQNLASDTRVLAALSQLGASLWQSVGDAAQADVLFGELLSDAGDAAIARLTREDRLRLIAAVHSGQPRQLERAAELAIGEWIDLDRIAPELAARLVAARDRNRALRESLQRERDLSFLLKLTADYAESFDASELLHDVTRRLASELDVLRASLIVLDEQRDIGVVVAASDDASLKDLQLELSRYPEIREVVRTGKPVLVDEVPNHPLLEGVKSAIAARGIHSIAALPLAVRGKVIGVLLVRASERRRGFNAREMSVLATVAHATAIALRNARLIQRARGQTEQEKTARLAAEERAAQLQRYEAYFANVSEGIAILDEHANLMSLNPAGAALLDVNALEARGRHLLALTNPTDESSLMDLLLSRARDKRKEIDLPIRTVTGRSLTLAVAASPIDEAGAASIVSFRDVTVERRLADELRQTKDFLERLIDSSVDAIIAADMKGKIILFNKGAEAICGYPAEEAMRSLNVRDLYPPNIAREVMTRLRSSDEGGRGRLSVTQLEIVSKSGERVPVNLTASILYEGDREIATVGIFTDLRARMQLERKLSDAETRLEESERSAVIVALAGTAAHELNQPLTSVMGYAELLKRKLTEKDFAFRPVDIIYREAERMAEIVRKIGKITRYETKAYVGTSQILDLDKASSHEE